MRAVPVFVILVAGCAVQTEPRPGVQVGGEPADTADICERAGETESTAALSDLVLDGHSGAEAMALLAGPHVYTPTWYDGRSETLTLTGEAASDTVTVYASNAEGCELGERIVFDARFHLVSEHGAIDERWDAQILWDAPWDSQDLTLQVPVGDLGGTLDPQTVDPAADQLLGSLRVGGGDVGTLELVQPGGGRTSLATWGP